MTIDERARKICRIYERFIQQDLEQVVVLVAAELRAVQEEGFRKGLNYGTQDAFNKGLLRAAEMAENEWDCNPHHGDIPRVVEAIRKEAGVL